MDGYGKVWSESRVESELMKCIKALNIGRMPTSNELKSLGRNDLHLKVSRTLKYSGWAERLGLDRKMSETLSGQNYETLATSILESFGHHVERMSTKFPYDLLINETVKIDVKTGRAYMLRGESRVHSFGINKKEPTCDIYLVMALSENDEIERTFIIPSHRLKVISLCIGADSKYNRFIDRWDYIDQYTQFFKQIV